MPERYRTIRVVPPNWRKDGGVKDRHFIQPHFYRYEVARVRRFRPYLNRYPPSLSKFGDSSVIGVAVVVGRFAYCVRWAALGRKRAA